MCFIQIQKERKLINKGVKLALKVGESHCCWVHHLPVVQNILAHDQRRQKGFNIWCELIKVDQMWCNCSGADLWVQTVFLCVIVESAAVNNWPRSHHHHCRWKCELCCHHFWMLGFSPYMAVKDDTVYLTLKMAGGDKLQIMSRCPVGRSCWG